MDRFLGAVLLLLLGGICGWWLHRAVHPAPAHEAEEEPPPQAEVAVAVARVEQGDLALAEPFFGRVTPELGSLHTVSSRAGGMVLTVAAAPGQTVHEGDVLLQLDPAPLEAAVLTARQALAAAENLRQEFERGGRERIGGELTAAEAQKQSDLQQAEAEVARLEPLRAEGLVADKMLTDARFSARKAALEHATAVRALAVWRDNGAGLQHTTLVAGAEAAAAALQQAELARAEAEVRARVGGRVLGMEPRAGDRVEPGQALGSLLLDDRRLVVFSVASALVPRLAVGSVAVFRDPAGEPRSGTLARIAAQAGTDGLVEVTVAVQGAEPLLPGTYVRGEVETERLSAVTIVPAAAVVRLGSRDHVVVRQGDGTSHRIEVEVTGRRGDRVAVKGSLEPGADVVTSGGFNLPDGTKLTVAAPSSGAGGAGQPGGNRK